jgi:C4-type Zn-finger protein
VKEITDVKCPHCNKYTLVIKEAVDEVWEFNELYYIECLNCLKRSRKFYLEEEAFDDFMED